jgi:hypothetical protein
MKRFIDQLRELGLYGAVNDLRYLFFPDVIATTEKPIQQTAVEYTTHAQILFTDLIKALEDNDVTEEEREQLLTDLEQLKLEISKLEGQLK